jgi:iron complex outermembrane receptor protein
MLDTVYTNQPNPNYLSYNRDQFNNSDYSYFFGSYTGIQLNKRTGAYVSDVISWNDQLFLQLAARYDYYINSGYTDATQDTTIGNFEQGGFSPKLGIVYQIKKDQISLFANYQNSFQNVNGSDFDGTIFIPQQANQLEGGVKWNIWKNRLHGTLSYYDIQVTNSVRTDPEHPTFSIQDGTQRSKGFEADLTYNGSKGLLVTAGYGYNDNIYTEADESVKGRRPVESGAAHLAHAFASYTIMNGGLKNFNISSSMNYSSKKFTTNDSFSGVFYIPSYTVFNGGIGYSTGKYNLALTVNNITSERYWVGWNNLALQKPREIIGSVRFNF